MITFIAVYHLFVANDAIFPFVVIRFTFKIHLGEKGSPFVGTHYVNNALNGMQMWQKSWRYWINSEVWETMSLVQLASCLLSEPFFSSLPKVYLPPLVQNVLYLHMPNFGSYIKAQLVVTASIKPSRALKCVNFPFTKPPLSVSLDLCVLPGRAGMSTPHPHSNLVTR